MCARFARACKMFLIKNVYINLMLSEEIIEKLFLCILNEKSSWSIYLWEHIIETVVVPCTWHKCSTYINQRYRRSTIWNYASLSSRLNKVQNEYGYSRKYLEPRPTHWTYHDKCMRCCCQVYSNSISLQWHIWSHSTKPLSNMLYILKYSWI